MSEYGQWITCTKLEDCEVIIENDGNGTFTSGYLKLTPSQHEEEKRLEVRVRGCNSYGCGKENHVEVHPHAIVLDPPSLSGVEFTSRQTDAVLRWSPPGSSGYDGVDVTWKCDSNKSVTYNNWFPRAVSTPGHSAWYRTEPYGLYSTEALIEVTLPRVGPSFLQELLAKMVAERDISGSRETHSGQQLASGGHAAAELR
ncbi:uncharacterized protein LOC144094131 isoform X1 [Amblyomma americanum]